MTPLHDPPGGVPIEAGVITVLAGEAKRAEWRQRATKRNKEAEAESRINKGDCPSYQRLEQPPRPHS